MSRNRLLIPLLLAFLSLGQSCARLGFDSPNEGDALPHVATETGLPEGPAPPLDSAVTDQAQIQDDQGQTADATAALDQPKGQETSAAVDQALQPDQAPGPDLALGPDQPLLDSGSPSDTGLVCPGGMANFTTFCIDQNQGSLLTWTDADTFCKGIGKRLCADAEWYAACNSTGQGMVDMVGDWEWLADLVDAANAKKRGYSDCNSLSSHSTTSGTYRTRCCKGP